MTVSSVRFVNIFYLSLSIPVVVLSNDHSFVLGLVFKYSTEHLLYFFFPLH